MSTATLDILTQTYETAHATHFAGCDRCHSGQECKKAAQLRLAWFRSQNRTLRAASTEAR